VREFLQGISAFVVLFKNGHFGGKPFGKRRFGMKDISFEVWVIK
jgi:hypothetical protein